MTCLDCARKEECLIVATGGVIPDCHIYVGPKRGAEHPLAQRCARCGHPRGDHGLAIPGRTTGRCLHAKQDQRDERKAYLVCMCVDFVEQGGETRA